MLLNDPACPGLCLGGPPLPGGACCSPTALPASATGGGDTWADSMHLQVCPRAPWRRSWTRSYFLPARNQITSLGTSPRVNLTLIPLLIHSQNLSTCPGLGATLPPRIRGPCLSVAPPAAAASPRLCPCGYGVQKGGPPLSPGSCSRQHIQDDSSTLSEGPGVAPIF